MPQLLSGNYTPEITEELSKRLMEKRRKRTAQDIAAARSESLARGLEGDPYEASLTGRARASEAEDITNIDTELALKGLEQQRQERLLGEERAYTGGEVEKGRQFTRAEREASQLFGAGESEKGRKFITSERLGGEAYGAGESEKERTSRLALQELYGGQQKELLDIEGREGRKSDILGAGLELGGGFWVRVWGGGGGGAGGGAGAGAGAGAGSMVGKLLGGAGAGYAGTRLGKLLGLTGKEQSRATQRGAKAGQVGGAGLGFLLGGKLGAAAGGALGGKAGATIARIGKKLCFVSTTPVEMADGTFRHISMLHLGEMTKGGEVLSIRISKGEDIFNYQGVFVTGSHGVKEDGKWIRVKDSPLAFKAMDRSIVYAIITSDHRIFVHGIEFADEVEVENGENLTMEDCLRLLNKYETHNGEVINA